MNSNNTLNTIDSRPEERLKKLILEINDPNEIIKLKNDLITGGEKSIKLLIDSLSEEFSDEENLNYLYKIIFVVGQVYNDNSRNFGRITEIPIQINKDFIDLLCEELENKFNNIFIGKTVHIFKEKLYLELGDKLFDGTEIRKLYSKLKVSGNNLKVKIPGKIGTNFGSILQLTDDYVGFSQGGNIIGISKYDSNTKFGKEQEQHNDKYRIYEDITRFESFDKKNNSGKNFNLAKYSDKLLMSFIQYYNSDRVITKERILQICSDLFLDRKSGLNIGNEIINFISEIEKKYGKDKDFFQSYKKEMSLKNNIVEIYKKKLAKLTGNIKYNKVEDKRQELVLSDYEKFIGDKNINIGDKDSKKLSLMMKGLHSPELLYSLNKELKIDLTKLDLQTQLHLLNFLWKNDEIDFENIRKILPKLSKKDKYTFLKTFLVSSIDLKLGKTIINIFLNIELTDIQKSEILERYRRIMLNIDMLVRKTYIQYIGLKTDKTILDQSDILKQFVLYTATFFKDIENSTNIYETINKFDLFDNEIKGIFLLISSLTLEEIEKINLKEFGYIETEKYSAKDLLIMKDKKSKKFIQISEIIAKQFSLEDLEAFEDDFMKDESAELFTLNASGQIIYIVGTRDLDKNGKDVLYIDWLASNPNTSGFSLRLTENFLKNELYLGEFSEKEMEALGEPHILTSFLLLEKFGFVVIGTSGVPEGNKYGEEGDYLFLVKLPGKEFITKKMTLEEIKGLIQNLSYFKFEKYLPKNSKSLLKDADKLKELGYVITRMPLKNKDEKGKNHIFVAEKM